MYLTAFNKIDTKQMISPYTQNKKLKQYYKLM